MRILGRTERRVVSAILVTALIPLVAAIVIARTVIQRVSAAAFQPEFSGHLHSALGVYRELASAVKQGMRYEADAIALEGGLLRAVEKGDGVAIDGALQAIFKAHPALVSIDITACGRGPIARRDRGRPVDPETERALTVRRTLGAAGDPPDTLEDCEAGGADPPAALSATFATGRARFDELESAQEFVRTYDDFARDHRERYLDQTYRDVFAVLLGCTIVLAIAAGIFVVRPVTNRIARLAAATRPVAEGDLSVRVADQGKDEVADLGRAFNRMLEELSRTRARIEFLRRMSEWQKVARRLAHEIKNPLTPIQLAVEECHRRYEGSDPAYQRILDTLVEVVTEEVASLRRLVSEFSNFARLPRAELHPGDLGEFLREQRARFAASEGGRSFADPSDDRALSGHLDISFEIPDAPMPAVMDREMLHRALTNIVQNAAQAVRDEGRRGRARVTVVAEGPRYVIDIDDDGPGIAPELRSTIFDPYVTTKRDGTGLGLSIVKKIIVDHGGTIEALAGAQTGAAPDDSRAGSAGHLGHPGLGGARIRITIPRAGTAEARAACERAAAPDGSDEPEPPTSRGRGS